MSGLRELSRPPATHATRQSETPPHGGSRGLPAARSALLALATVGSCGLAAEALTRRLHARRRSWERGCAFLAVRSSILIAIGWWCLPRWRVGGDGGSLPAPFSRLLTGRPVVLRSPFRDFVVV